MAGRHAQEPERKVRPLVAVAVGVGAVIVAAAGVILATTSQPDPPVVSSEVGTSVVAAPEPAAASSPAAPPAALTACADSLQRGAAVVTAADASRDHWGTHVRAQTDYDARAITRQQMLDQFAATKAAGPADLAAFDQAEAAYTPVESGCAGLDPAAVGAPWRTAATQCAQRSQSMSTAVAASTAVVADWRAHVAMMQAKPHTDPNAYGKMWRDMVNAAPPHLDEFSAARDALAQQPPCELTPAS